MGEVMSEKLEKNLEQTASKKMRLIESCTVRKEGAQNVPSIPL